MSIHPTAVIDAKAELDSTVTVGPYTVIEAGVRIDAGTEIHPHAIVSGNTTIGKNNLIGSFSTIGVPPQDLHYRDEPTRTVIGDDNLIREYVSIHRGTPGGTGVTTIGNKNLLMAYVHVAHDCSVGNGVIMANAATLGGHVQVDDKATLGGLVAVHQFSRIGEYSYIGGMSGISKNIPPYVIVAGVRNQMRVSGINKIGLRRAGFSNETIKKLHKAFLTIYRDPDLLLEEALERVLSENPDCEPIAKLVGFFRLSGRNVVRSRDE